MDDRLQRLADKAKGLPKAPGVYLMKDDKGRVIYVGKSASLRDRGGSYFQPSAKLEFKKAPLRDDDDSRRFFRPCLLYPIKQCTAPCAAKVSKQQYRDDIAKLIRFLDGDKKKVIAELEKEMIEASKDHRFERAAQVRDEIKALQ